MVFDNVTFCVYCYGNIGDLRLAIDNAKKFAKYVLILWSPLTEEVMNITEDERVKILTVPWNFILRYGEDRVYRMAWGYCETDYCHLIGTGKETITFNGEMLKEGKSVYYSIYHNRPDIKDKWRQTGHVHKSMVLGKVHLELLPVVKSDLVPDADAYGGVISSWQRNETKSPMDEFEKYVADWFNFLFRVKWIYTMAVDHKYCFGTHPGWWKGRDNELRPYGWLAELWNENDRTVFRQKIRKMYDEKNRLSPDQICKIKIGQSAGGKKFG
jgi:hypothetical protein